VRRSDLRDCTGASFGNSGPHAADAADAATCNCPAAEPPIADRIVEAVAKGTIPANSMHNGVGAACPSSALTPVVINGSCVAGSPIGRYLALETSESGPNDWDCIWTNTSNADITVTVKVHCLMPPK
jgi:hypothetical protein